MVLRQSTCQLNIQAVLQHIAIVDHLTSKAVGNTAYLISSHQDTTFIDLDFAYIPPDSPTYKQVDNLLVSKIGAIYLNVNRPTIASLLQTTTSITQALGSSSSSSSQKPSAAESSSAMSSRTESSRREEKTTPTTNTVLAHVKVHMEGLIVNLNKEGYTFMTAEISNAPVEVHVNSDSTMLVKVSITYVSMCLFCNSASLQLSGLCWCPLCQ